MNTIYQCPVCGLELKKTEGSFACAQKHSYDISKRGYVNLLLANQKRTKDPGDSKTMIENRKYFLEQGYFDSLSDKVNEKVSDIRDQVMSAKNNQEINVLDLGCGEGYYAARLRKRLDGIRLWGIDISKAAIHTAAKRDPVIQWCVGSNFQLPYLNGSLHGIFSIFSPFDPGEITRVLSPGGTLIVVRAGTEHLKELASLIYDTFEPQGKGTPPDFFAYPDMNHVQATEVRYQMHIKNSRDIESLIGMTPYVWSLKEEKKMVLSQKQDLTVTADFQMSIFQKTLL